MRLNLIVRYSTAESGGSGRAADRWQVSEKCFGGSGLRKSGRRDLNPRPLAPQFVWDNLPQPTKLYGSVEFTHSQSLMQGHANHCKEMRGNTVYAQFDMR
jgi:hypothetical protein